MVEDGSLGHKLAVDPRCLKVVAKRGDIYALEDGPGTTSPVLFGPDSKGKMHTVPPEDMSVWRVY